MALGSCPPGVQATNSYRAVVALLLGWLLWAQMPSRLPPMAGSEAGCSPVAAPRSVLLKNPRFNAGYIWVEEDTLPTTHDKSAIIVLPEVGGKWDAGPRGCIETLVHPVTGEVLGQLDCVCPGD